MKLVGSLVNNNRGHMKNKTKAQLIEIVEDLTIDLQCEKSNRIMQENTFKIVEKDRNKGWDLLLKSHKKINHQKRIIKRDAKIKKEQSNKIFRDSIEKNKAKYKSDVIITELKKKNEFMASFDKSTRQHLKSCENANLEKEHVITYLELRVSELTIMLNEK